MNMLTPTSHATVRMAQRGFRMKDVELIALVGTKVCDGYFVRDKDCQELERALKSFLERLKRIRGKRLVIVNDRIVTAYRPSRKYGRMLMCNTPERDL